jgi:hypothetical protein
MHAIFRPGPPSLRDAERRRAAALVVVALTLAALLRPGTGVASPASAPPSAAPSARPSAPLDGLGWITGCWASEGDDAGSGEVWLPPAGDILLGVSRTVRRGRTVAHEFMQIRSGADGRPVFVARPSGQAEGRFVLQRAAAESAWFENLAHDFPQRVGYWRDGARLRARIEGSLNGTPRAIEFAFRSVPCDKLGAMEPVGTPSTR